MPPPRLADLHPLEYIAKTRYLLPKEQIAALFDMEYPADPLLEPTYVGMTYRQVALVKQIEAASFRGSRDALDFLLDRMVGKPAQTITSVAVSATYQDYLDSLPPPPHTGAIDVEPTANGAAEEIT